MHTRRVASLWLLFGALSGIALAGIDILEPNMKVRLDDGTMALVNGVPVSLDRYRAIEQRLEVARLRLALRQERQAPAQGAFQLPELPFELGAALDAPLQLGEPGAAVPDLLLRARLPLAELLHGLAWIIHKMMN